MNKRLKRKIGKNLSVYRLAADLTQEELAKKTKIGREAISKIETGKQRMSVEQLLAFCRIFKVKSSKLLGG